jgi:hypothetical protein
VTAAVYPIVVKRQLHFSTLEYDSYLRIVRLRVALSQADDHTPATTIPVRELNSSSFQALGRIVLKRVQGFLFRHVTSNSPHQEPTYLMTLVARAVHHTKKLSSSP